MVRLPRSITRVITAFERLPGIGQKTAARLTFYLLNVPQEYLSELGTSIVELKQHTLRCSICGNIDEASPCVICSDSQRDATVVCVVEQPLDIIAIEKTGKYHGRYHVLHGVISPLDNIGPDELTIARLIERIRSGEVLELILATNASMEGEATAMYIADRIGKLTTTNTFDKFSAGNQQSTKIKVTRLAHGLPVGGDIEYADEVTLTRALEGRREY